MTRKEREIVSKAFEIIKRDLIDINNYYNYNDNQGDESKLKKLTKISIPGFGCFYISNKYSSNRSLEDLPYTPNSSIFIHRVLKFRPYGWTKSNSFAKRKFLYRKES